MFLTSYDSVGYESTRLIALMVLISCCLEQVMGYGWAGILRKYVVDPAQMWWPSSLVQVSLFRFEYTYLDDSFLHMHIPHFSPSFKYIKVSV